MSGTLAIPASQLVNSVPGVLSAGGSALDLIGLALTTTPRVPIGTVKAFSTQANVASFFGATSPEAAFATNYFLGFNNSTVKPGSLLFAQYNAAAVGGYLWGGSLLGIPQTTWQGYSGILTVSIDGTPVTSTTINLSSATSLTAAAELITVALGTTGPAQAAFTGVISGTTVTVSNWTGNAIAVGQEIRGSGIAAGTQIVSFGTGTGGNGTYIISGSFSIGASSMTTNTPTVTYDTITGSFVVNSSSTGANSSVSYGSGTIAANLMLTQAAGAVISPGAAATNPTDAMNTIVAQTTNWATFTTLFNPDVSGNANKLLFAAWANSQTGNEVNSYIYVPWDSDPTPTQSTTATASLGYILTQSGSNGTFPIYSPSQGTTIAAFFMGAVASINFDQLDGRIDPCFKSQGGLVADVTNATVSTNLQANGYNFYGKWNTANQSFSFLFPGSITGEFLWADSYVNQIWMNNQFQLAIMVLFTNVRSIPYNHAGYDLIRAALLDPIQAAGNFGAWRAGVTLSNAQIQEINGSAGFDVATTLQNRGWYLLIQDASPQVRAARGSPPCTFWYVDGQSVHKLNIASIEVQ